MIREIERTDKSGKKYNMTIEPKIDKGFIKVSYMRHHEHHNKNFRYEFIEKSDATAMILFNYDYSKFYLVKQFRPGAMEEMWEIPAGVLEKELTPVENSLKEIEEETGYKKEDITDIIDLGSVLVSAGYTTESIHLSAARLKKGALQGEKNFDENEAIVEEGFYSINEAEKMGAFFDMKTAMAYYRFNTIPKKRVGIFGGTFDPITNLHIRVALRAKEEFDLDEIVFEPVGDKYSYEDKSNVTDSKHRLKMLSMAIETEADSTLKIGDYDIKNSEFEGFCPTIDVMEYYKEIYGNVELFFICGTDNLKGIDKWQRSDELLSKYKIIVFQRNSDNIYQEIVFKNQKLLNNRKNIYPIYEIIENNVSSSKIKEAISAGMSVSGMVPTAVRKYIENNCLYKIVEKKTGGYNE